MLINLDVPESLFFYPHLFFENHWCVLKQTLITFSRKICSVKKQPGLAKAKKIIEVFSVNVNTYAYRF